MVELPHTNQSPTETTTQGEGIIGYTHYFEVTGTITPAMFKEFAGEAHEILRTAEINKSIQLANGAGDKLSEWVADEDGVRFNGFGDDAHETFSVLPTDTGFNFCKTARKPYDVVVVAVLIALFRTCGDAVKISSDGDHADWAEGSYLYQMAVQRTAIIPIKQSVMSA